MTRADLEIKNGGYMISDQVSQSNKKDTDTNDGGGVSTVTSIFIESFLVKIILVSLGLI